MTDPHIPMASASPPDEDPTGVRALLSALPEPDPMPDHLVERINASLAAAQAQRAASSTVGSVAPLVAGPRRRMGRVLFAMAGAAAAVALMAVVGSNLFTINQQAGSTSSAAGGLDSSSRESSGGASAEALSGASAGSPSTLPLIQIRLSETRYTQAGFAAQAATLRSAAFGQSQLKAADSAQSAGIGRLAAADGLTDCLRAVGADGAQVVRADLAFYEGAPAVVIVATTDGMPVAYAVGRDCSLADPAVLRPATSLP